MAEQVNNSFFERMRKLFSTNVIIKREDGKVLKPEGWSPPDLKSFVKK